MQMYSNSKHNLALALITLYNSALKAERRNCTNFSFVMTEIYHSTRMSTDGRHLYKCSFQFQYNLDNWIGEN